MKETSQITKGRPREYFDNFLKIVKKEHKRDRLHDCFVKKHPNHPRSQAYLKRLRKQRYFSFLSFEETPPKDLLEEFGHLDAASTLVKS